MKSDQPDIASTIAALVRDATPVAPLDLPSVRVTRWALVSAAAAVLAVAWLGARPDLALQLGRPWFAARAALTLATAMTAAVVAVRMSVPGLARAHGLRAVPWALCLGWGALLVGALAATGTPLRLLRDASPHLSCCICITAIGLVPGVWLMCSLRQAAPLDARWTGGCAGLAGAAAGALATQFVCGSDAPAHHLLWHLLPVAVLALAQLAVAPLLFSHPDIRRRPEDIAAGVRP